MAERPSPHSIAICAFITLQHREDEHTPKINFENKSLSWLIERLLPSRSTLSRGPSSQGLVPCVHPSFSTLLQSIDSAEHSSGITQALCKRLKSIYASVDALIDFFEYLASTISNKSIATSKAAKSVDGTSLQGIFIRKQALGYQTLSFESITRLWDALCRYINATSTSDGDGDAMELWPPSVPQMETYLQDKCLSLDFSAQHQLVDKIKLLQSYYPQVPSLHYYEYLYSIQCNERMTSYEAFYRYFDYSMIQERRRTAANVTASTDGTMGVAGISSILQYAPIELAALHAEFGYLDSSRMATQEAIRVAQQYHDGACVAYSMGWMSQQQLVALGASGSITESKDFLQRCIQRAVSNRLYHLASGAALSLAQHEALASFTHDVDNTATVTSDAAMVDGGFNEHLPCTIWNAVSSASTLAFSALGAVTRKHHRSTIDSSSSYALATYMPINAPFIDTHTILAQQNLVSSAVWEIFGNSTMSSLLSTITLDVYGEVLSGMEYALANHKAVMGRFFGHRSGLASSYGSEVDAGALDKASTISAHATCQASNDNAYFKAFLSLLSLRKMHCPPHVTSVHTLICYTTALLFQDWAISQGKLYDIQPLAIFLNSVADGGSNVYGGIVPILQVTMQSTLTSCYFHRWEIARKATRCMIALAAQHRLSYAGGRLLYQLCEMTYASDVSHPARVLPMVLECISLAQRLSYDSLHATAIGLLAKVFLSMGYWRRSIYLVRGSLPFVLAHAPLEIQGVSWLTLAKCFLLKAGEMYIEPPPSEQSSAKLRRDRATKQVVKALNSSLLQINEAIALFQQIHSVKLLKEAFYLKARLCNDLYFLKRNEAASEIDFIKIRNVASNNFRILCRQEVISTCLPEGSYDLRKCLNDFHHMEQLVTELMIIKDKAFFE